MIAGMKQSKEKINNLIIFLYSNPERGILPFLTLQKWKPEDMGIQ